MLHPQVEAARGTLEVSVSNVESEDGAGGYADEEEVRRMARLRVARQRRLSSTAFGASWTTTSCGRLPRLPRLYLVLVSND